MKARRRAQMIRSLIKELTEPWPHPGERPSHTCPIVEEEIEKNGEWQLTYRVEEFNYKRTVHLSSLEAATLRYSLHQSGNKTLSDQDRELVEGALAKLEPLAHST